MPDSKPSWPSPMIWLKDVRLRVERAPDRRTGRVFVHENDALASGERPAIEGAAIRVDVVRGDDRREVARGRTGAGGVFGFPVPSDVASRDVTITVDAEGFNTRRIRLDGTSVVPDLVAALYGGTNGRPSR